MITMRIPIVSLLLLAGCQLDADIRAACATRHDVAIDAVPAELDAPRTIDVDVELELDELEALRSLDAEIRFAHVRFAATAGVDDLAFVSSALVTVASANPDATLPTLTVVDCDGDCPRDGVSVLIPAEADANVLDYAAAGTLALTATIGGAPPPVAWALDIEVCAEGEAAATWPR